MDNLRDNTLCIMLNPTLLPDIISWKDYNMVSQVVSSDHHCRSEYNEFGAIY